MAILKASIITIGDELLIGQTIDTNSAWMAQNLNEIGVDVIRRVAVGDEKKAIADALTDELEGADIVLITGGLGPTADDITKPLLCDFFKGKMIVDEQVLAHIKSIFEKRKRPFLERNLKQAEVPDNCKVLFNQMGTAPGMLFEQHGKVIIAMPGVPFEMMYIMQHEVLPYVQLHFTGDAIVHRSVITAGEGESFIAEKIEDIEQALPPHIKLAYLPGAGMVKLRLTAKGKDKILLIKETEQQQEMISARLENIVVSLHDLPLEHFIGTSLLKENATLSLAESCTGGFIAHHITQITGSGQYFKGGIVSYTNEVKESVLGVKKATIEKYGAVSEQTAIEMAENVRKKLDSDYSLSVTGLLSEGGDEDSVPVGTVWMAVADKERTVTKEFRFFYDRLRNKELAVQMGMLMIWKMLHNKL